ncbi:uncharacterized protein LOC130803249 isoform X4 [Amaranthus tricolor]|uniref:uncharacterized protein LOC130803249 isoform X4 n=1 Tax=Amaranthus tricolor TaxID=29722 RepID=UPI00258F428C|nr:uncharacterized protein LOC130803249 isoform X4 [Amaranthus tricolor]
MLPTISWLLHLHSCASVVYSYVKKKYGGVFAYSRKLGFRAMGQENRQNAVQVVKKLLSDEGWIGLYRGLGPRFFSMSAWGTCMILAYEYISLYSYLTLQILGRCFQSGVQCCQHNFLSVGRHSTEIFGSR